MLATERYDGAEPVNVGAGFEIRIQDLVALICRLMGFRGEVRWNDAMPDGQPRRCLDTSRAARLFGFRATTSFEEGLGRTDRLVPVWSPSFLPSLIAWQTDTPDIGRVAIHGRTVHFRAAPQHRGDWLRRIDPWIAYANSVVEE